MKNNGNTTDVIISEGLSVNELEERLENCLVLVCCSDDSTVHCCNGSTIGR